MTTTNNAISHPGVISRQDSKLTLAGLYRNWQTRRQIRRLQDLDDRILDDIGVTFQEVLWASYLPLKIDAARALEKTAYRRRKEQQLMWL